MFPLARIEDGCRALVAAGACKAVVDALSSAANYDAKAAISRAISELARIEHGRRALIAALVDALSSAAKDGAKAAISKAMSHLARIEDGCRALVAAGACKAVVD
jgi:RNA polymerase-interacting CarD/CdnL/TRCF family regulator